MRADIDFKNYTDSDYEALCSFLIALNKNNDSHINWNWARRESCGNFYIKILLQKQNSILINSK